LMYSFAQHSGVQVIDEPLYGHYLRVTGADHPGRDEVMAAMHCDAKAVMQGLLSRQAADRSVRLFAKNMAHHLVGLDLGFLNLTENVFLVRDPRDMLPSLTIQLPRATLADTGLKRQWQLYESLVAAGDRPAVIDSRELLLDPRGVLKQLCDWIGLSFDAAMLSWPEGPSVEDGVWAPYWYHAVHQSTGFGQYVAKTGFPDHLLGLLSECMPWYDKLYRHALRARPKE
jgi:hypothetical protein